MRLARRLRSTPSTPRPARARAVSCSALALTALLGACHSSNSGGPIVGTIARFDTGALTAPDDFYGLPFPSDLRLDGVGIGLAGFPNPENSPLLTSYIAALHDSVTGFGTAAVMYVSFSGPLDPTTLPTDPAATLLTSSPVQVIDIDTESGFAGEHVPLEFKYYATKTLFVPANTIAIRPVPGAALRSGEHYALVVTDALKDAANKPVVADALTRVILGRVDPIDADARAIALTQPFLRWAHGASFPVASLQLVSAFTTQDAVGTMRALRSVIRAAGAPEPTPGSLVYRRDTNQTHVFTGTFPVMNFQAGLPPYQTGGGFVLNGAGAPISQRSEAVRFALTVPKGAPPANGFPVVLYAHGTGGSYLSCSEELVDDSSGANNEVLADALARKGMATLTMDQVLHGPRNPHCDESSAGYETCVGTDYFNFVNPYAGRDNTRQGGADALQLIRLAHTLSIPASLDPEDLVPTLDPTHIAFLGHSQGGLTGAPFVAAEPELTGAVFSGTGGTLTITILERKDPVDFKALAEALLGIAGLEELEPFHPVLSLVQTFIEPSDTINYGRHLQREPLLGGNHDLLLLEGMHDPYVPQECSEALGAQAGLDIGGTAQHEGPAFLADGLRVLPLPITQNAQLTGATRTNALLQFPNDDHFAMFDNPIANCQVTTFLQGSLAGSATVAACQ